MKKVLISALIGVVAATFALDADAQRRLGGGKSFGKQQQQVQQRQAQPAQQTPQQQQAAPAQQPAPAAAAGAAGAAGAAKAASPMRNMLIGAAAGLGLMALASYLGFGETLATIMLFVLLGLVLLMVVGFIMRRMRGNAQPAYAGMPNQTMRRDYPMGEETRVPQTMQRSALQPTSGARAGSAMDEFLRGGAVNPNQPWGVPADFDGASFLANAKTYFGKLQAAWDKGDLNALSEFTTDQMFIALTHELRAQPRTGATTDVQHLDAVLLGIDSNGAEHIASVRFTGKLSVGGEEETFDEVWNLSKSASGQGGWLLAGIQQLS